ncbi:MAG: hypothetical protein LZF60_310131 [Nitrospira sp.]|nr:hypothetical protein [Nitrospira sp.]ULA61230.1 MAG: hypothetical protein LZF60_310131 [Nitrospira sp.]
MGDPEAMSSKQDIEHLSGCQVLKWFDHPLSPGRPLPSGMPLEEWDGTNIYSLKGQSIGIDLADIKAKVYRCSRNDFDASFSEGSSVLNFEADPLVNLVHLRFNPPVQAVGTHVAGAKRDGREYKVSFMLLLADGSKSTPFAVSQKGTFSSNRDTAPFVGAKADTANPIVEMYCDIYPTGNRDEDTEADVAIGDLYFVSSLQG